MSTDESAPEAGKSDATVPATGAVADPPSTPSETAPKVVEVPTPEPLTEAAAPEPEAVSEAVEAATPGPVAEAAALPAEAAPEAADVARPEPAAWPPPSEDAPEAADVPTPEPVAEAPALLAEAAPEAADGPTPEPAAAPPPSEDAPETVEAATPEAAFAAAPPPPEDVPELPTLVEAAVEPETAAAVSGPEPSGEEASGEMDMAALLETEAAQPGNLRRGEIIDGVVMGASPDGVIVDVGTKTEAVIPQAEMLSMGAEGQSRLKTGDTVRVMVLQPMSAEGHGIVSLDRARGEEGWDILAARLDSGETFSGEVVGHNRGGILANVEGVNAFIPLSQVDSIRRDDPDANNALATLVGKEIRLKVIELNRRKNRAILSERAAMAEWRREQKERIIEDLQEGEIRDGRVSSITDFGVFIDLGGADGLAHLTELTWERGKKAKDLFTVGDEVKAYVLKVDREARKISLSLKRAHPEEWDNAVDRFVIGQVLIGRVTKLMPFGSFVRLDGPIEGLIHISEVTNRRIQHPKEVLNEGDVVPVKLVRIEKDRHRLGLSLRQARNDAEAMGFGFNRDGSVIDWPDDVRSEFGLPERDESQLRAQARTAQEAVEQAVAGDPEPVSAFAHAFAQAIESADGSATFAEDEGAQAETSAGEADVATAEAGETPDDSPEAEAPSEEEVEATAEASTVAEAEAELEASIDEPSGDAAKVAETLAAEAEPIGASTDSAESSDDPEETQDSSEVSLTAEESDDENSRADADASEAEAVTASGESGAQSQ